MADKISATGFGDRELANLDWVEAGDRIQCRQCGKEHILRSGSNDGKPGGVVLWFKCGETTFIGAIANRCLIR